MTFRPWILWQRFVFAILWAKVACSASHAFVIPLQQYGSVLFTADSVVVEQESSTEIASIDLRAGSPSGGWLKIDPLPDFSPWQGFQGQLQASANSFEVDLFGQAIFNYDFQLLQPTDYIIRYDKQGDASSSFAVSNESGALISYSDVQSVILEGRFDAGEYSLSAEASAFAESFIDTGVFESDYARLDFSLYLMPVPEPGTITLSGGFSIAVLGSRYVRRWHSSYPLDNRV